VNTNNSTAYIRSQILWRTSKIEEEWAGYIIRIEEEMIPKKGSKRKLPYHKTSGKTKN
jgi:hypothetical protein